MKTSGVITMYKGMKFMYVVIVVIFCTTKTKHEYESSILTLSAQTIHDIPFTLTCESQPKHVCIKKKSRKFLHLVTYY